MTPPPPDPAVPVYCPQCRRRYLLDRAVLLERALRVVCGNCETLFEPLLAPTAAVTPAPRASPVVARPTVVVAHDSPAVCATVGRVLEQAGFCPRYVHDGARAVAAFDDALPDRPVALILDVGIPEMLAFQVIAVLRAAPQRRTPLHIILLASVFEKTRYKRQPKSLHGANAYLELHHVPDRLGRVLQDLMNAQATPPPRTHLPVERAVALGLSVAPQPVTQRQDAVALARRLVSDVALYQERSLAAGAVGNGVTLSLDVRAALDEALDLMRGKVKLPPEVVNTVFEDAVAELLVGLQHGADPGATRV